MPVRRLRRSSSLREPGATIDRRRRSRARFGGLGAAGGGHGDFVMYLLDTDTLIYGLKGVPAVTENFRRRADKPMALSVITYGELIYGATKSAHATENLARVRRVAALYSVIDVSQAIMDTFALLKAQLEAAGQRLDDFDLVIAATALALGFRLVTNNERHFKRVQGLPVENWSKRASR